MKNHIYRLDPGDGSTIEFQAYETNDVESSVQQLQAGMYIKKDTEEIYANMEDEELDSLIGYLQDLQCYIKNYNKAQREALKANAEN